MRFEEKAGPDTRLKFMTDGILLAETQHAPDLRQYHTLILDEAHERSLNIDFLLGYLKLLLDRRKDLRLVISSATLDAVGFSEFFGGAPIVQVEGRTYPAVSYTHLPVIAWPLEPGGKGNAFMFKQSCFCYSFLNGVLHVFRFPERFAGEDVYKRQGRPGGLPGAL